MSLLDNLNNMQREAVNCTEGPLLLLAGAGSGKTRVLTVRIAHLIENGVSPYNILALTFTNKAAKEMRERVNALIKNGESVWVSTFHSTCVRILRSEIENLSFDKRFTIYDADDSERLLRKCIKELNVSDKQFPLKSVQAAIGTFKDSLLSPEAAISVFGADFRQLQMAKIYLLYQKKLKENNALDFDDIIFFTVKLFREFANVLEKYQERFKYLLVDEYQDTSTAQYELVRLLSSKYKNICVVGDDDQSIYGWRGANIGNILGFEKDFKGAHVIKLEQNYRSSQTILNTANAVIANNISRKHKKLWTENEKGCGLTFFKAGSDREEAQYITEVVESGVSKGGKYSDYAVLYRNNAISRAVEEQLVLKGIPYRLFGGVRFYDRKEIKDILSYLKFLYNPYDSVALLRIINVPKRGIGDTSVEKVAAYASANDISFFDALNELEHVSGLGSRAKNISDFVVLIKEFMEYAKTHTIVDLINKVLEDTKYLEELKEGDDIIEGNRIDNIGEFIAKAAEFEKSVDEPTLEAFLEEVSLVSDLDNLTEDDNAVMLMTMHSSKGLEFPTVFVVGFEEGIFPSYRSVTSGNLKDLEEERRLCYVAITRARERLYLTAAKSRTQHGQIVYNAPSRFLKEMPVTCFEEETQKVVQKPKVERTGVSQFAEIHKTKNSMELSFGAKNYSATAMPGPKAIKLDFQVGDSVRQMKYGVGIVKDIKPAGADYEVTVEFPGLSEKKFMAHLSKLSKV